MDNLNMEDFGFLEVGDSESQLPEPDGLSDFAKKAYYELGNAMIKANLFMPVDTKALRLLCYELEQYEVLRESLKQTLERHESDPLENNGFVYRTMSTNGEEAYKRNPLGEAFRDKAKTIRELMEQLGLTPKSRNQMNIEKVDKLLSAFKKAMED